MKTGAHLRIEQRGSTAMGVRLHGDPRRPEPNHFLVTFPGGEVEISRTTDGAYWVHLAVNDGVFMDNHPDGDRVPGAVKDARIDIRGRHASDVDCGELGDPGVYHVAFLVGVAR